MNIGAIAKNLATRPLATFSDAVNDPTVNLVPWFGPNQSAQRGAVNQSKQTQLSSNTYVGPGGVIYDSAGRPVGQQQTGNSQPQYSTGSAGSVASKQQNIDLVNAMFGAKKAGLGSQLGTLDAQQQAGQARIGNQYQTKYNDLSENLALGQRNLGESRNVVEEKRARSLGDIRDRLNSQSMSYANQLGAMGAGDSSATGLVSTALSGMASKNRGDVQENATGQLHTIDTQEEGLKRDYERGTRDLDTWRQTTLSDLATEILKTKQQIQQALAQADAEQAQQLVQYDAAFTQQAVSALSNLENTYASHASALADRYRNILAPQDIRINPENQQYEVKPIDPGVLRSLQMPEYVNPETEAQALLRKREEDEQNAILSPIPV